jgi:Cof subfamily protein (haloacid dehalogenase superfamily)
MARLFVSDLDGTLLDAAARLTDRGRDSLGQLVAAGMHFTIASARSVHSIAPILEGLPLRLPIVEFNGAFLTDLRTRESVICHTLDAEIAAALLEWGREIGVPPLICTYVQGKQRMHRPLELPNAGLASYVEGRLRAGEERFVVTPDLRRALDEPIVAVVLIGPPLPLARLETAILERFPGRTHTLRYENRYSPGWWWLTVQSQAATKEHGLREVAQLCGVALPQVTVFGDEVNDIPMFRVAGTGVAVENAIDELKSIAHEIIGPHHEDSVVEYLLRRG